MAITIKKIKLFFTSGHRKYEHHAELVLSAYKNGHISEEFAKDCLSKFYENSRKFNWHSFRLGTLAGTTIYIILKAICN